MVRALLRIGGAHGVDARELRQQLGLANLDLTDPEARVPRTAVAELYRMIIEKSGDETIGLQVGSLGRWGSVPEYYAATSATLGEAFERGQRVVRLITDAVDISIEPEGEYVRIGAVFRSDPALANVPPIVVRQFREAWAAVFVSFGRAVTGVDWAPEEVCFCHPRPDDTSAHDKLFRAPLRFGCTRDAILVSKNTFELPITRADSALASILEAHCEALLAKLPRAETCEARVRRLLAQAIPEGRSDLVAVARALGMSARTLQRRLSEEGTSHQQIVDDMRQQLAHRFLAERQLAIAETAALLGYSDTRAFHRAFRRWTGQTPHTYRETALNGH